MDFRFNGFDDKGMPTHVTTDDGFMQTSRRFDPESDGWMLSQLEYDDFPAIEAGYQMKQLVDEVNRLRRENFTMKKILDRN